jgi:hypothetical protein
MDTIVPINVYGSATYIQAIGLPGDLPLGLYYILRTKGVGFAAL